MSLPTEIEPAKGPPGAVHGEIPVGSDIGQAPAAPLSLRDVGELLVKHYGLTEGTFEVTVTFQLGVGAFGPDPENLLPSGIISVQKIGLRRAAPGAPAPGLVDAGAVAKPGKKAARPALRRTR